jgi:hypothetical protein
MEKQESHHKEKKEEIKIPRKRGRPAKPKPMLLSDHPLKKDAPVEKYFILCNGKPVKNIKELAEVMETLEDHVFNHHVRPEHNDFSAWVMDIFNDVELAQKLADAKDKQHTQLVIYKHITHKLW